ncbi:hypothetical protein [uncultured Maribacter sp.]|uniref:hypothetical protein n=1 Tax=Flavobacteriaceae TaxID=49546 RepID=UPI0030D72250|tara:strand:- start:397 stop:792 length:396 start_codon:yes stop_codon:yes gene_type:complete
MKNLFIVFLILLLSYSCSNDEIGKWDDNIKLSQKEFQFDSKQNSAIITTEGEGWWISEIYSDKGQTYDFSDTDTTIKNFVIINPDFKLERKNATEISITMFENQTNSERTLKIGLQAGNYFDGIKIIQSAD